MSKNITDQTLALAGIFQAAAQVNQLATQGRIENDAFETALRSLLMIDAATTEEVYGGADKLGEGLRALIANLGSDGKGREVDTTRYVVTLLHLERKLSSRRDLLTTIAKGIEHAQRQSEHFPLLHDNIIAGLADLYVKTISTLTPRIMVSGQGGYLQQPDNANRVRALLLAGIRSAVLWNQKGGGRLRLLFQRGKYVVEAQRLLRHT